MKKYFLPITMLLLLAGSASYAWMGAGQMAGSVPVAGSDTVSFRSYDANDNGGAATTVVVTKPSGTVEGDIMIAFITADIDNTITPPDGWAQIDTALYTTTLESWAYYKIAGASEGADYTWTGTSDNLIGHILTFSKTGGTWADPSGAGLHSSATANAAEITTGSVTALAGSFLVCGFSNEGSGTVSTPPADMTLTETIAMVAALSQAVYYESRSAGAVTKTITWAASEQLSAIAVVVGLQ